MIELSSYIRPEIYKKNIVKNIIWELISFFFFNTSIPGSRLRSFFLRILGAKIGYNIVIKPNVKIKYPWNLKIGDFSWIGEKVWIDNIAEVSIGRSTCISQGVYICSASHDFKKKEFDLLLQRVEIGNNCWIAAKSLIGPNVIIKDNTFIKMGQKVISKF